MLNVIECHLVSGYADGGDVPEKQLTLMPGAAEQASEFLQRSPETSARFDKVADLMEGFESPFGLELISTVHWVMKHNMASSVDDVVRQTYAWSERKQQFSPRQISLVVNVLTKKGWVTAVA